MKKLTIKESCDIIEILQKIFNTETPEQIKRLPELIREDKVKMLLKELKVG